MQSLKVIAFTHKTLPVSELAKYFIAEEEQQERLHLLKRACGMDELLYLATCNRVEFIFSHSHPLDANFFDHFFKAFFNGQSVEAGLHKQAQVFEDESALKHLMQVASSLDSMVVGEREIITQVRNAYERCKKFGLTGDLLRLVIKNVIVTAKEVFTKTGIAEKPVSVVSLAYRKLKTLNVGTDARFVIVGAGETNTNLLKYLAKHGYKNFTIFNRTLSKAQALAESLKENGGDVKAWPMEWFWKTDVLQSHHTTGMDVLITCTGASEPLVTRELYSLLTNHANDGRRVIIDLAMPSDVEQSVIKHNDVHYIGLNQMQEQAERNLSERQKEIDAAETIIHAGIEEFNSQLRTRKVELRMQQVPEKIRAIRDKALNDVFANEVENLDEQSKELLNRVLDYVEKKYMSVPMVMAKEILLT